MELARSLTCLAVLALLATSVPAQRTGGSASPAGTTSRTLTSVQARIVGLVHLPGGVPAAGAEVSAAGATGVADALGRFEIAVPLEPGQSVSATARVWYVGASYRGESDPMPVLGTRVDLGIVALEASSMPMPFAMPLLDALRVGTVADLDGDGDVDLVAVTEDRLALEVHENGPEGFVLASTFGAGTQLSSQLAHDFDVDGDPDLLVGRGWTIELYLNDGLGGFGAALPVTAANWPRVVAPFDGDAVPDLVFARATDLTFMRGLGDGTLAPPVVAAPVGASKIDTGDFDGDGVADLVLGEGTRGEAWRGVGDGTFTPLDAWTFTEQVLHLHAEDVDGDGTADLLAHVANFSTEITWLTTYLVEDGVFAPVATLAFGSSGTAVRPGHVDSDGRVDLLITHHFMDSTGHESASFELRTGVGDGVFQVRAAQSVDELNINNARLADLDGDGHVDVLLEYWHRGDGLVVYLGRGNGQVVLPQLTSGTRGAVSTSDHDGDGDLDLLIVNTETGRVQLSRGNGNGVFGFVGAAVALPVTGDHASGDLDGDADVDVIAVHGTSLAVLQRGATGALTLSANLVGGNALRPVLADFDADGDLDLAASSSSSAGQLYVYRANGDGTFGARAAFAADTVATGVLAADLDANGAPDLALEYSASHIDIFEGLGDGTFLPPTIHWTVGSLIGPRSATDVDGDGVLDLLTSDAVSLGLGDGSFAPPRVHFAQADDALDLDGDGRIDLAGVGSGRVLRLRHGFGNGDFGPESRFLTSFDDPSTAAALLGDYDGDGDADVLVLRRDPVDSAHLLRGRRLQ
jgi:hypothetical protein